MFASSDTNLYFKKKNAIASHVEWNLRTNHQLQLTIYSQPIYRQNSLSLHFLITHLGHCHLSYKREKIGQSSIGI